MVDVEMLEVRVELLLRRVELLEKLVGPNGPAEYPVTTVLDGASYQAGRKHAWAEAERRAGLMEDKAVGWDMRKAAAVVKGRTGHFEAGNARAYRRASQILQYGGAL